MKKTRKVVSTLVAVSLVGGLMLPVAGPAFAYSKNSVDKVISIANDNETVQVGQITIREDKDYGDHFKAGDSFQLVLPSGVKWSDKTGETAVGSWVYNDKAASNTGDDQVLINPISDQKLEITMPENINNSDASIVDQIILKNLYIKADSGVTGDIKVKIDPRESGVSQQELVIARAADGDTVTIVEDVETIGDSGFGGTFAVEESAVKSMGDGSQVVKVKLPSDFEWALTGDYATVVTLSGGFAGMTQNVSGGDGTYSFDADGRTLTIKLDPLSTRKNNQRGVINVKPGIKAKKDAKYGEVTIDVSGDKVTDFDGVIAKYADFGVDVTIKEVKELMAGRFDEETEKVTIEESVPNTMVDGRKFRVEFPSWVKVSGVNVSTPGFLDNSTIDIDDNVVEWQVKTTNSSSTVKAEMKFKLSIQGDKSGDITAVISGKSGATGEIVVAKAVTPVSIASEKAQLKIGVKNQALKDIIITENKSEAIAEKDAYNKNKAELVVKLPDNVNWNDYKVEVIEGNLEIEEDSVDTGSTDNILVIPIKSDSSKASKIKISGITVDLDRTVAEGDIVAKVQGSAVAQNDKSALGWDTEDGDGAQKDSKGDVTGKTETLDDCEFNVSTVASTVVATVVTPAPEAGTATFNIGSTIYTAGGVTKVMDAAPYIKDGRTYVPVRYLALALGVAETDIGFENGVVTLKKGADTVTLTIGSTTLMQNDTTVTMDVAPEVVNGRTMLPARFVAEAFGAIVGFANGQVVISN
ncbi:stalk domain-containing protein [Desulforamulus aeronauticus]|uniref:Copper amine oxidase N-terminal domain-containing protein n=1 Tax=Desulforamulus aeronauticus DSM 10349 TaxID=1121421 RepID=A0A1M6T3Z1_9FIRM|nr:copper amine oxidase N-terminal domain-containing protein [Desulforamulus aeronauticus]SHK51630.1 Copper amine oxidase N-terminal domain-containing protein [Desulforamulus aeronauticus DSM 10349]